uniref:Uncharacterized protein n=1 Tax=Cyclophora tenuis TaxID=216820 RepID=A0A7S1GNU3_CYCTE
MASLTLTDGFVTPALNCCVAQTPVQSKPTTSLLNRRNSVSLYQSKGKDLSGTDRGLPIMIFVMFLVIWGFTIPPEFRRTYICSDRCVLDRQAPLCNDCKTPAELRAGIVEYYKNGGGIQWDFSVDPNSPFKL